MYGPAPQLLLHTWTARALYRALTLGLLTENDIHFSTDDNVWNILLKSNDSIIMQCIENIMNYASNITIELDQKQPFMKKKFRGLDPLVKEKNQLKRLTAIDGDYEKEYNRVQMLIQYNL